jgi:hypothetical protein
MAACLRHSSNAMLWVCCLRRALLSGEISGLRASQSPSLEVILLQRNETAPHSAAHTIAAAHPEANRLWIGRTTLTAPHSATAPALLRRSDRKGKRKLRPKPESEKRTSRCVGANQRGNAV